MPFVPYPVGDVTDPYADCGDTCGTFDETDPYNVDTYTPSDLFGDCGDTCASFDETDPYDASGGAAPYGDCGEVCSDPGYVWTPWGDGYFYVRFPLSTYVTNTWAPGIVITTGNWPTPNAYAIIAPSTDNGYYYRCPDAYHHVTTGATEPTWPTVFGETVIDNGSTWECYGYRTLVGDHMSTNFPSSLSHAKKFGDYILTMSNGDVLECWDAIPNIDGKKNANENVELVWRQHVRTFPNLHYDEHLYLIVAPANDVIFLATEDGWNGDGVNWLNTDGSFDKYTRLRTRHQAGVRIGTDFAISRTADTIVIKSFHHTGSDLHTVTFEYDSPGIYIPTNDDIVTYADSTGAYHCFYSATEASVVLDGDDRHSLVTLNGDGSVTSLSRLDSTVWTNIVGGQIVQMARYVAKVQGDYLLIGPVGGGRGHRVLCEPDTINPITY